MYKPIKTSRNILDGINYMYKPVVKIKKNNRLLKVWMEILIPKNKKRNEVERIKKREMEWIDD